MPSPKLFDYLRARLSQDELAFLLGTRSGSKVCRYERHTREPNLTTVFAFETNYHTPARDLFGGVYAWIERLEAVRAERLAQRLMLQPGHQSSHKVGLLRAISHPPRT